MSASPKTSIYGDSVLVDGLISDISAGTTQNEQAARFPNGVTVMSDASMTECMAYVYHQKPMPTNLTGVEVKIETLDPNGNFYEIGTTTTDASGMFKLMFTPEVPGEYTIMATFDGSGAYYGSYAQTAIGVSDPAPTATAEPVSTSPSMADLYLLPGIIVIVIAIAIVGALILLALRKRP
jgi:hypothetical protein